LDSQDVWDAGLLLMRDGEAIIGGVGVEVVLWWDLDQEVRG
jgi:hypothetical protein